MGILPPRDYSHLTYTGTRKVREMTNQVNGDQYLDLLVEIKLSVNVLVGYLNR